MTSLNEPARLTEKIPRPRNAFILFRQHHHKLLIDEWTVQGVEIPHNSKISKILGIKWKALSGDEKIYWEEMARKEKSDHEKKYPDYRYKPIRKHKKKQQQLQQQLYIQHALYNSNNNVMNGGPNFLRQIVIPNGNTNNNYVCSPITDSSTAPINPTNGHTNNVKTREENTWKPISVSTIPRHATASYDNNTPLPSFQPQQDLNTNIPNGNQAGQYNTASLPLQQGSKGNVPTFEQAQSHYQYIEQNQNSQTKPNQHMYPYFVQPLQQNYLSKPIPPNRSSGAPQPGNTVMMPAGMNQNVLPNQNMLSNQNQNMLSGAPVMYPTPLQMQLQMQMQMQMEMQMQLQLQMQMQMQMNKNKDGNHLSNVNTMQADPFNEFAYHSHQYPQPFIKKPGSEIALQPIDDQQRLVTVEDGNNEKNVQDIVHENDINSDYHSVGHK